MIKITVFEAVDGKRFDSEEEALAQDRNCLIKKLTSEWLEDVLELECIVDIEELCDAIPEHIHKLIETLSKVP